MYQPRTPSRSEFVPIRNLKVHVQRWGEPAAHKTPLVMAHGWMDVAASWQFVIDAFAQDHDVIAFDWRGFGLTESPPTDNYWMPDYLADLDFLLDHYAPDRPVDLVGHSMGGNLVMQYAGARPERISKLVNLEGFGMAATRPAQAPGRYAQWMDQLKAAARGEMALKTYDSVDGVARRLMKTNGRLGEDKAQWLARQWARPDEAGKWKVLGDAAHKIINAQLFRVDEMLALYAAITAPVLFLEASDSSLDAWWKGTFTLAEFHERLSTVAQLEKGVIQDAGHMLHHDQPQQVAQLIETFLAKSR
ncbi:MAG TPA: alpha/beta hydrolase [Ramlibacter sp.]|nr:alpha/beta hydrolase [Ramlibacter sp.]